jgi:hypothetical protein
MRLAKTMIAAALLACAGLPVMAQGQTPDDDLAALKAQLQQLKVNPFPPPRERSAQILVAIVRRMDVSVIDKATIDEIAGLLEDNSDTVRGRMAIAIGNIGPAAKHTVPALQKAFVRAKEHIAAAQSNPPSPSAPFNRNYGYGVGTSADSICFAMMRLEEFPPDGCLDGRYQPAQPQLPPADGSVR